MRQRNPREARCKYWYRHMDPPQSMWRALDGLSRYVATARVAKHRLFAWLDARIRPDSQLIVIARDDDTIVWDPTQPVPRGLVAPQRDQPGAPSALHPHHHL